MHDMLSMHNHNNYNESTTNAMEMIPDLTHYSEGLSPDTFPLKVTSHQQQTISDSNDSSTTLDVNFTVVTREQGTAVIALDGQGFRVISFSLSSPHATDTQLSARQEEVVSGELICETIEALLMALSPAFETFFGQELARKLENVSWDQNRFQHSSDDDDGSSADEHDNDYSEDR